VAQLLDLILADYYPCMCAEGFSFLVIGTIQCKGCVIDRLRKIAAGEDSDYESASQKVIFKKYRAIEFDAKGIARSTYPELHPLEKLYDMRDVIGQLRFDAEKQNEPRENSGIFKEDDIRYWNTLPEEMSRANIIVSVDPSFSETADNKAMFVMLKYEHGAKAKDWQKWKDASDKVFDARRYFIILSCYNRKESVDLLIEQLYTWDSTYAPKCFHIEGNFNQRAFFEREFARYARDTGKKNLRVRYVNNLIKKEDRIASLDPYIRRGEILFPRRDDKDTEATVMQLIKYDGGKKMNDDGPDALAMGINVLLTGEVKKKMRF
jgi:predicted phage terminase large subunit-like protein